MGRRAHHEPVPQVTVTSLKDDLFISERGAKCESRLMWHSSPPLGDLAHILLVVGAEPVMFEVTTL